jgi:SAM-dependent methyltransferase
MDTVTVDCYNTQASTYADRYEAADMSAMHQLLLRYLPPRCRVLEIGCGSGRDAAFLLAHGYDVTATDASPVMLTLAAQRHPELASRLHQLSFPTSTTQPFDLAQGRQPNNSTTAPQAPYDAILSVATLMHIPDQELFECATQIRDLLVDDGILVLQLSLHRSGLSNGRDDTGRLYNERPPEEVQLLFERLGFRLVARADIPDFLNRDIRWYTLILQRATGKMARSVDEIETIITRDRKDATYKLALLRALCDIAQYESHMAKWRHDGTVSVPLGLVAEKWLLYYWSIIELDIPGGNVVIPQKRGLEVNKPIAFRRAVRDLAAAYAPHSGLSALYNDYKAGTVPVPCRKLLDTALNTIAKTIVSGPVTFTGGALEGEGSYFAFEGPKSATKKCVSPKSTCDSLGLIIVPGGAWREMSLIGHWVSESIILRWAELTHELSEKQVPVKDIIGRLLIRPVTDRDVQFARKIYADTPGLRCVWTDKPLKKDFAVDHTIPFSISRNNDLWNLLPAATAVNLSKSDKLVAKTVLLKQRDAVIHCWELLQAQASDRFEAEITRALFHSPKPNNQNWQQAAFSGLVEQVETLALQRGLMRWAL